MEKILGPNAEMLYKDSMKHSHPVIKCGKVNIIKEVKNGKTYAVFAFSEQCYAGVIANSKICFIDLGRYFLVMETASSKQKTVFDFAKLALYDTTTGAEDCITHAGYGQSDLRNVVILNKKIIAICGKKGVAPRFFAVVADKLTELSAGVVEDILRFRELDVRYQLALKAYYQANGWENHNGILINPNTLEVPSELLFALWKRNVRRNKAKLEKVDIDLLASMLTRSAEEKPAIKYINF